MARKWGNEYGMALVLLALCAFFSVMTWDEQRPSGRAAAQQLLADLESSQRILIVAPDTNDGRVFAEELFALLPTKEKADVQTVLGEPFFVRDELTALLGSGKTYDTIAVHPAAYAWTVFDRLAETHAELKHSRIVTPAVTRGSNFLRPTNLLNIANQIAVIAIIAIGMTMVIITGGIDLSVGSLVALSAVTTMWTLREYGGGVEASTGSMLLAGLGGILICGLMGTFSGVMITRLRTPAFIVTLSVMLVARGLAGLISQNQSIDQAPKTFTWLGIGTVIPGLPNAVVLALALYVIAHLVMTRTVFGRHVYAVGGNRQAAWLSGVPVNRVLVVVYALTGLLAGLAGVVLASQFKSGAATYGVMYEMSVICAVVVGGTSLTGGEGRIVGTLVGALIIAVIQNGMNLLGIESNMQMVVLGGLTLGAVVLDGFQRRQRS